MFGTGVPAHVTLRSERFGLSPEPLIRQRKMPRKGPLRDSKGRFCRTPVSTPSANASGSGPAPTRTSASVPAPARAPSPLQRITAAFQTDGEQSPNEKDKLAAALRENEILRAELARAQDKIASLQGTLEKAGVHYKSLLDLPDELLWHILDLSFRWPELDERGFRKDWGFHDGARVSELSLLSKRVFEYLSRRRVCHLHLKAVRGSPGQLLEMLKRRGHLNAVRSLAAFWGGYGRSITGDEVSEALKLIAACGQLEKLRFDPRMFSITSQLPDLWTTVREHPSVSFIDLGPYSSGIHRGYDVRINHFEGLTLPKHCHTLILGQTHDEWELLQYKPPYLHNTISQCSTLKSLVLHHCEIPDLAAWPSIQEKVTEVGFVYLGLQHMTNWFKPLAACEKFRPSVLKLGAVDDFLLSSIPLPSSLRKISLELMSYKFFLRPDMRPELEEIRIVKVVEESLPHQDEERFKAWLAARPGLRIFVFSLNESLWPSLRRGFWRSLPQVTIHGHGFC